jgi:hypothetical protein
LSITLFKRFTATRKLLRLATVKITASVPAWQDQKFRYKRLASPKTTAYYGIVEAKKNVNV